VKRELTASEREVVRFVGRHQPCLYRDVQGHMGWRSTNTAFECIRRLRALGVLRGGGKTPRGYTSSRSLMLAKDILVSENGDLAWIVRMNGYIEEEGTNGIPVS
jgi:hypothetical protein